MPFITIPVSPPQYQLTFDDILNGISKSFFEMKDKEHEQGNTKTVYRENTPQKLLDIYNFPAMLEVLKEFNQRFKNLIDTTDKSTLYYGFKIPKQSLFGKEVSPKVRAIGLACLHSENNAEIAKRFSIEMENLESIINKYLRQIDAPYNELKFALRELKYIFEDKFRVLHHTTAFAYVKKRSTIDAIKRHQKNNSRWFLKLDFSNFFGSTTLDFVMKQLEWMFPFNEIMKLEGGADALKTAVSLAFLKDGLPQGTPFSPTITNIMMIPIDHHIAKEMRELTPHIVYTRYADDLILSSDLSFNPTVVQEKVLNILNKYDAPFTIKEEKTRYGSSAGRNWNLGVMLNKDNKITIGTQKKRVFKAMLFSLHDNYKNGVLWSLGDIQELQGLMSYYLMVEKDNIQKIIDSYDKKYKCSTAKIIKETLANPAGVLKNIV